MNFSSYRCVRFGQGTTFYTKFHKNLRGNLGTTGFLTQNDPAVRKVANYPVKCVWIIQPYRSLHRVPVNAGLSWLFKCGVLVYDNFTVKIIPACYFFIFLFICNFSDCVIFIDWCQMWTILWLLDENEVL